LLDQLTVLPDGSETLSNLNYDEIVAALTLEFILSSASEPVKLPTELGSFFQWSWKERERRGVNSKPNVRGLSLVTMEHKRGGATEILTPGPVATLQESRTLIEPRQGRYTNHADPAEA
jgi:hypothetical protein